MTGRKILFIRLRSLGDTILMTPALTVAKKIGSNQTAVVSEDPFSQILEGNPDVDQVLAARRNASIRERLRLLGRMRRFRADIAIDLHGGTTAAFLTFFSGARVRVGYASSRHAFLYNHRVPNSRKLWRKDHIHTVEHQLSPLLHLGFKIEEIPPLHVPLRNSELERIDAELARLGVRGRFALLHPAAAFLTKQWPVERFAELARRLNDDGVTVVATAGPGEERLLADLRDAGGKSLSIIPPSSISGFSALVSRCELYIGNDTGTTHIAAALSKPVVAVFGSSDSDVWSPWRVPFRLVKSDLPCIPCPGYRCLEYDQPQCILSIEVDRVYQAVRSLMR